MHYYQHNIADYRKDTQHLCFIGHGIYRQLMDSYYLSESPLPSDENKLMRLLCVRTKQEKSALRDVLTDFFIVTPNGYIHKRCDVEIEAFHSKSRMASASANERWKKKRDANALPTQSEGNPIGMLTKELKNLITNKLNISIPDWLPEDLLQNFKEHRVKMKKPMTDEAVRLFITKLSSFKEAGHDPVECINRSILNGWAGVFEPKDQGNNVVKQTEWKTY